MALTKNQGGKATKAAKKAAKSVNLIEKIKELGFEVSTQKTKLWSEPEFIADGLTIDSFDSLRVSLEYEDSVYAILRSGNESKIVPFMRDELDVNDLVFDEDTGIINPEESGLTEMTFSLGFVTAMRDDEDFEISEGDRKLKLFVE